ncbi:MAG: thymidylate kinase [Acidimicrobiia bacterium]|nr:MAG: thymidylate kinase [Acidimicrobiia bacterium]
MPARYIALEGVEGAGKSTVAELVAAELQKQGRQVVTVREPGGTRLGEEIRRLLLHSHEMDPWAEAALFCAQRAQLAREVVAPALAGGAWVVSDRSYYSSLAYQGYARGLGVEQVRTLNELALNGVVPDLVVVLDVEPEVGLGRQREPDRIGGQGVEFQRRVAEGYRSLAAAEPHRVVILEGGLEPEVLARRVVELAEER